MGQTESEIEQLQTGSTAPTGTEAAPGSSAAAAQASETLLKRQKFEIAKYNLDKKIRVGCIGVGARLKSLLRLLMMMHADDVQIVALADEAQPAIDTCLKDLKEWLPEDLSTYNDYKDLIARDDLDWIMIGSKNYQHHEHCIAAFKSNRHVFCEKPLAITIEQCEQIRAAQKEFSKLFVTGFVLRHADMYRTIHKIVTEEKLLGKIITVEANEILVPAHGGYIMRNWRRFVDKSGPHILEKCCHDIDILNWILDSVPSKVTAVGGLDIFKPENKPAEEKINDLYEMWDWAYEDVNAFESEKTIEDNLMGIMQYRNAAKVVFHTICNSAFGQRRLLICGLKGTLEADLVTARLKYQIIGQPRQETDIRSAGSHGGGDYHIIEDLVRSMVEGTKPAASGEEGFRSAIVCLALDRARREGGWVDLEPYWKNFDV